MPSTVSRQASRVAAATVFHALSDETRLAVIEMLRGGERCVCDLQDALDPDRIEEARSALGVLATPVSAGENCC